MRIVTLFILICLATVPIGINASTKDVPPWTKFDEYSEIPEKAEQRRLKNFIFQLRESPDQIGVIVAYGGENTCPGEAQVRASRVRRFLLKNGIHAQRIKVVDAGYQREWRISLFIGAADSPPLTSQSLNSYDGHIDVSEVKTLHSCKGLKW
jgi:hypothetical protein